MTPDPKSLARGGLFCFSTLILEAIFGLSCPDVFQKNSFGTGGRFMCVWRFVELFFFTKITQKCLGGVWDHPRPIPDHSGPILTKNRLKTEITKIISKIL